MDASTTPASNHNAHPPDPATTDQTILPASEPPPPAYNTMPSIMQDDTNPTTAGPAQVVWGIIGVCVLCFIFYIFIRVTTVMEPGRT